MKLIAKEWCHVECVIMPLFLVVNCVNCLLINSNAPMFR